MAWLGSCSAVARGGRLSFADTTCAMLLYRTVACNRSGCSGRCPFVCLSSLGIFHTSGEAAFPRPRLGQVLTPLGVNIIALARTVIIDCMELNCYICQRSWFILLRGPWLWFPAGQAGHCDSGLRHAFLRCTEFLICKKRSALHRQLAYPHWV